MKLGEMARFAKGGYWVTPRYNEWVTKGRNLVKERDALMRIMTRPKRVRTNTFSASGAGRCLRERQFGFIGLKGKSAPNERTMNIFANGDYVHLRHQVAGLVAEYMTEAEVSVANPEVNLTGTMDGMLTIPRGLEIKSINDRGFTEVNAYGVKKDHEEQVHSYMLTSGLDEFAVVYENKNTNDIREFLVEKDDKIMARVTDDLTVLNQATDAGELVPMLPECVMGKGRFARCQYSQVCPKAQFVPFASPKLRIPRTSSSSSDSSE